MASLAAAAEAEFETVEAELESVLQAAEADLQWAASLDKKQASEVVEHAISPTALGIIVLLLAVGLAVTLTVAIIHHQRAQARLSRLKLRLGKQAKYARTLKADTPREYLGDVIIDVRDGDYVSSDSDEELDTSQSDPGKKPDGASSATPGQQPSSPSGTDDTDEGEDAEAPGTGQADSGKNEEEELDAKAEQQSKMDGASSVAPGQQPSLPGGPDHTEKDESDKAPGTGQGDPGEKVDEEPNAKAEQQSKVVGTRSVTPEQQPTSPSATVEQPAGGELPHTELPHNQELPHTVADPGNQTAGGAVPVPVLEQPTSSR